MTDVRWRKSSHSGNQGDCVELPGSLDAVRDSKNGDTLRLNPLSVAALLNAVKRER